jgi:hypothetical protein
MYFLDMSNRNFDNRVIIQRLQQQNYARNLYRNNTTGQGLINNPQNTDGTSSRFNSYRDGAQTEYFRGLTGGAVTVSLGGTFGIPAILPTPTQNNIQSVSSPAPNIWTQLGLDIDGEAVGDFSGFSVSVSADGYTVAIGAYNNDGVNGTDSGHVRVYKFIDDIWTKLGQNIDGEAESDNSGSSVSLSADGSIVAIGADFNDGTTGNNIDNRGHVRVYTFDNINNLWTQLGQDIDGEALGDNSGWPVNLSADGYTVAIGAYTNNGNTGNNLDERGHVRVYKFNNINNVWTQQGQDIDGEATGDWSGVSVSLSADGLIVAIGAQLNDGTTMNTGDNRGHVRVYKFDNINNIWTQQGQDIDGEAIGDNSGISVSLSADGYTVAIGAIMNDGNKGHVRVYKFDNINNVWAQQGQDIDGEATGDFSGISVSLSANGYTVAIGATMNDGNRGHVRVYKFDNINNVWTQQGLDIDGEATGDFSGRSVSLSADGSTVAIGAQLNDGATVNPNDNRGHVRVYKNYALVQ